MSFIEGITLELTTFLEPFLGLREYGNIIVPGAFPKESRIGISWRIGYFTLMGTGSEIRIRKQDSKWYYSFAIPIPENESVNMFKLAVSAIPVKRKRKFREWLEAGGTLQSLEEAFNCEMDKWHTEDEIEYAKFLEAEINKYKRKV